MKTFCSRHRKLLIWLGVDLALLILFWALRPWKTGMEGVAAVSGAFRRWLGQLWSGTRISGMEVLCVLLALFVLAYLIWNIAAVARAKGRRGRRAVSALLGAVNAALAIYLGFCWLWGVSYYVDGFQEKSGVYAQPVSLEDLTAVTEYFARACGKRRTAFPGMKTGSSPSPGRRSCKTVSMPMTPWRGTFPSWPLTIRPPRRCASPGS